MDRNRNNSKVALRIVFGLSLLLVVMDSFEIVYSLKHLMKNANTLSPEFFNSCIKYHVLSQIFFTMFATLAGVSACLMSSALLINYEFFSYKGIETYLYWNYMIFGPYLLGSCVLSGFYLDKIIFNCDSNNFNHRYLNFSTIMALLICFILSSIITFGFTSMNTVNLLMESLNFRPTGNKYLGKLFWEYVIHREVDEEGEAQRVEENGNEEENENEEEELNDERNVRNSLVNEENNRNYNNNNLLDSLINEREEIQGNN